MQAPRGRTQRTADGHAARRDVPGRSRRHRRDARSAGPRGRPGGADPRMARALCRAGLRGGGGDAPVLHRLHPRVRGGRPADRRLRAGRPRRHGRLARKHRPGLRRLARDRSKPPRTGCFPPSARRSARIPISRPHHAFGLRGLGAAGRAPAGRERRGPALCRHRLSAHPLVGCRTANGWRRRGVACPVPRLAGAGSRRAAGRSARTSPSARRPVVQKAKQMAIPSLYFTNLISARPLMGAGRRGLAGQGHQRRASPTRPASTK